MLPVWRKVGPTIALFHLYTLFLHTCEFQAFFRKIPRWGCEGTKSRSFHCAPSFHLMSPTLDSNTIVCFCPFHSLFLINQLSVLRWGFAVSGFCSCLGKDSYFNVSSFGKQMTGSHPVQDLNLDPFLIHSLLSCREYYRRHWYTQLPSPSSQLWFFQLYVQLPLTGLGSRSCELALYIVKIL